MSSKAAKRRSAYQKREEKRQKEKDRQKAIRDTKDIGSLAAAMGIRLN